MEGLKIKFSEPYSERIPDFCFTEELKKGQIANLLKNEIEKWQPDTPVLIDTPTGSGKTTFIYKCIIPRAKKQNMNVLIVSNRTALNIQQKKDIMDIIFKKGKDYYSDRAYQEKDDYGFIHIVTYQGLQAHIKNNSDWIKNVGYTIFDEAHFFTSDTFFNTSAALLLKQIPKKFGHTIRIYMTATSYDVIGEISDAEEKEFKYPVGQPSIYILPRVLLRYHQKPDYSKYEMEFISDLHQVIDLIKEKPEEKWLIFVDKKANGEELCDKLLEEFSDNRNRVINFNAEKKKLILTSNKENDLNSFWKKLLSDMKFEEQVLISTSVLDCGINIIDENVKNIVISTNEHAEFIQMLGRRRLSKNDQKLKLWVVEKSQKSLQAIKQKYEETLKISEKWENAKTIEEQNKVFYEIWENDSPLVHSLFIPSGNATLCVNYLTESQLHRRIYFLKKVIGKNEEETIRNYHQAVESWLNIKAVNSKCFSSEEINEARDDLLDFLEENKSTLLKVKNNEKIWDKYLTEEQVQFLKDKINTCREMNAIKSNKNHDTIEGKGYTIYLEKLGIKDFKLHTKKCGEWYIEKTE